VGQTVSLKSDSIDINVCIKLLAVKTERNARN